MTRTPTVYDVASSAGVSTATVSRYFRQPEKVAESTRRAIDAAVARLGYVPSGTARGLAERRTGVFGLVSFEYQEPEELLPLVEDDSTVHIVRDSARDLRMYPLFADEVMRGVVVECTLRHVALMVSWGGNQANEAMLGEVAGRVDGLIVLPHVVPEHLLDHVSRRIPVVRVASPPDAQRANSHVTVDNAGGMRALTNHLIRDHGLRDLWFFGSERESSDGRARFDGFRSALRSAGIRTPRQPQLRAGGTRASAREVAATSLSNADLPEAIVCANDQSAFAVMEALSARDVDVPGQVAVTGFDGIDAGRFVTPRLTTVRQPMDALGRVAVRILSDQVRHEDRGSVHHQLAVDVVLRESCGCAPE